VNLKKYFILGLVLACLATASLALYYRASYHSEYSARTVVALELRAATENLAALRQAHEAQLSALSQAEADQRRIAEERRTLREQVLNASEQDLPTSPTLRCAVIGVCD
jgi:hypothetical protein